MITLLGEKLRRLRDAAGLTQSEFAPLIGLSEHSKGYISEIESGKKIPPAVVVLRIARHFGVSTDFLLRDELEEQH